MEENQDGSLNHNPSFSLPSTKPIAVHRGGPRPRRAGTGTHPRGGGARPGRPAALRTAPTRRQRRFPRPRGAQRGSSSVHNPVPSGNGARRSRMNRTSRAGRSASTAHGAGPHGARRSPRRVLLVTTLTHRRGGPRARCCRPGILPTISQSSPGLASGRRRWMAKEISAAVTCWNRVEMMTGNIVAAGKKAAAITAPALMLRIPDP